MITLGEVYSNLAAHMIEGLMLHDELSNYFDLLGLKGYRKCHEYRYFDESLNFRKLNKHFINHNCMLIPHTGTNFKPIIPNSAYNYEKQSISQNDIRSGVKEMFSVWVNWESDTKKFYEESYKQLIELDCISDALYVSHLIKDVDMELKSAKLHWLKLKAMDYNISSIIGEQDKLYHKYKKKFKQIMEA